MYDDMKINDERSDNGNKIMLMNSEGHVDDRAVNINLGPRRYIG